MVRNSVYRCMANDKVIYCADSTPRVLSDNSHVNLSPKVLPLFRGASGDADVKNAIQKELNTNVLFTLAKH